jgi:hypothetical protein
VAHQRQTTLKAEAAGSFETYLPQVSGLLEHYVVWPGITVTAARTSNVSRPVSQAVTFIAGELKTSSSFPPWTRRHYVVPKHWQLPVSFPGRSQPQLFPSHSVACSSPHEPSAKSVHYDPIPLQPLLLLTAGCVFMLGHSHDGTLEHSKL